MEPIKSYEALDPYMVDAIIESFPGAQGMILRVQDIDGTLGAGRINGHTICVWTKDGYRITIGHPHGGGRIGTCSKEKDPLADPTVRNVIETNREKLHNQVNDGTDDVI